MYNTALEEIVNNTLQSIRGAHEQKKAELLAEEKKLAEKQREQIITLLRTKLEEAHKNVTGKEPADNKVVIQIPEEDLSTEDGLIKDTAALLCQLGFCSHDGVYELTMYW